MFLFINEKCINGIKYALSAYRHEMNFKMNQPN